MANQSALRVRICLRRALRRGHRLASAVLAPITGVASQLVPVSVAAVIGAAGVTAASVALSNQPAQASISGTALILSTSVNGGTASLEAQQATALGLTVTVVTPATWDAMPTTQFQTYNVIIIGDPSTTTCATTVPADALSSSTTWSAAINGTQSNLANAGNVAVLGTAPGLAGSAAASLVSDAIYYAASSGPNKTGLYVSLNCYYSGATAGTDVTLLDHVEGGGFLVTGQGANCPAAAGTVSTWQALALTQFNGLTSPSLGPWAAPACSVEETLTNWPVGLNGVGYYSGTGATPATFTASDGATGQAYVIAGVAVPQGMTPTAGLAVTTGGQVPARAAVAGSSPAAPGVNQPSAAGVNTATANFTQSNTDFSIPTFGPSLSFTRSYDSQAAQAQTRTKMPGPMGYGWSDNWASSLQTAQPVPGDIYTIAGTRLNNGNGGPPQQAPLNNPQAVILNGSNIYIADTLENRVEEISGTTGTQWGQSMTAGDVYTIVGSQAGKPGSSPDGTAASQALLYNPDGIAVDAAGNLYISDSGNSQVLEVPAASGTKRGVSMTANDIYRIAGFTGVSGIGGDNKPATNSHLAYPGELAVGPGSSQDLYIADVGNNRIQEIAATTKSEWGQSMTANYVYTVAGSAAGTGGLAGKGQPATSALFSLPYGIALSAAGNLYIADTANCRVMEVPPVSGTQWGQSMTANYLYQVAGRGGSTNCTIGNDNKLATQSNLSNPEQLAVGPGTKEDLYIADSSNNRIQEVSATNQTEWGQAMTATYVYTVAGSPVGTTGFSGDGGSSTAALMDYPNGVAVGSMIYAVDTYNNRIRVVSSAGVISELAGNGSTLSVVGDQGPAVSSGLGQPAGEAFDSAGDIFIADNVNSRIQEIAARSHLQFGINMTGGDVYTVAGSATGASGYSGDGSLATAALLNSPQSVAIDSQGNLYIADMNNCVVRRVSAATGFISAFAGLGPANCLAGANNIAASTSALNGATGVAVDSYGDVYIADGTASVREVFASGGQSWGQSMTPGYIYTVAGSATGATGITDGVLATSALLTQPQGVTLDGSGNLFVCDGGSNRVMEVAAGGGLQRGVLMKQNYIYTIAGSASGGAGNSGNMAPATTALLDRPLGIAVDPAGNVYIADWANSQVREVAVSDGVQWGLNMTANYIYTLAGSVNMVTGDAGDGGPASAALMYFPTDVALDPSGNIYINDSNNNRLREVISATQSTIAPAPGLTSAYYPVPSPGGITITQPDSSQTTFFSQTGGSCAATPPYVAAGSYCALPQDVGAALTFDPVKGIYTFSPQPDINYTYNTAGQLTGQSDAAGNALSVTYGVAPGTGSCPSNTNTTTCQVITSASGRALTVGYNSSNLITSVTDPMSRSWTYGYTGSNLTSAADPMGHVTSYGYDTANANPLLISDITTITMPNGQPGGPNAGAHATIAYDTVGRVSSETDPMGFASTYNWAGYNASTGNGAITVSDPDGNKTVYFYSQGTLAAQSAWTGSTLTSEQDYFPNQTAGVPSGGTQLLTASANGNGIIATRTYDTAGNLVTSTAPDGITNSNGTQQLATTTAQSTPLKSPSCISGALATSTCTSSQGPAPVAPGGVITPPSSAPPLGLTWALYDTYGNRLYTTRGVYEPGSNTAAYSQTTYQLFKGNTVTLGSNNISCITTPPSTSLPCAKINANGVVTQFAYNTQGDLTSSATPDGNGAEIAKTTYTYDGDGDQTNLTTPDGNLTGANAGNYTTVTAFNSDGQKTSVTEAGGSGASVTPRATNYGYDGDGNQTTVQSARGHTTTTTYNADDQPTLVTDPDLHATLTCYDGAGNVTQTVPPVGVAAGGLTAASCPSSYPGGYTTRLAGDATVGTFNVLGEKTQETTPAPAGQTGFETTSYVYDANGNLTQTTAPPTTNGGPAQITTDTYNSANQMTSETTGSTTPAAATISYCYDPDGNKTALTYGDANTSGTATCETAYPWVISSASYPNQASYQTTYAYDSAGETVSTTTPATTAAPSGATTSETYDAAGNTLTRTDPDNITATWTYTPLNKPATVTYSGGSAYAVTYGYDASDNRTSMTDATGNSSYIWDPFGELTTATNGASQVIAYGYNPDGRVSSITYPLPGTATWAATPTVNYGYDNADQLTSATDFNNNQTTITPNADALPGTVTLRAGGDTLTTTYSNTDNPSSIVLKNGGGTILQQFNYTDSPAGTILSECDAATCANPTASYSYDAKSRVTSMTTSAGTSNYGFDASSNLTSLPTGATTTYDQAGELTSSTLSGTTIGYTYNAAGQRVKASQGSTTISVGTWNGAGQLTAYSDVAANMATATYNGDGLRVSATTGSTTQHFTWDTLGELPSVIMDSVNAYILGYGLAPCEQVNLSTGAITYLVTDRLGSVRGTVTGSGTLTGTASYDAWGNPGTANGLIATTPFGYAGGYTDPTGLLYLINRYYDGQTGQFISTDPMLSQTIMPYAYADGNPVSGVDPRGLGRTGFSCGGGWGQPYRGWGYRYYGCTLWLDEWATNGLEIAIALVGAAAAAAVAWAAAAAVVASGGTVAAPAWMFVAAIAATIVAVEYTIAFIDWLGHNNGIYFRLMATRPYYVTYCTRHRMRVPCAYHETGGWVVYGYMWHQ